jgi:hypothetical protein
LARQQEHLDHFTLNYDKYAVHFEIGYHNVVPSHQKEFEHALDGLASEVWAAGSGTRPPYTDHANIKLHYDSIFPGPRSNQEGRLRGRELADLIGEGGRPFHWQPERASRDSVQLACLNLSKSWPTEVTAR